jgi:peroxiredoxin
MAVMISVGTPGPDFTLQTQFGTAFHLADYRGRHNVLFLFYPLDWTPT